MAVRTRSKLNPKRDFEIFKFIWRWKVVPTDILHKRFFDGCHIQTCYNRLARLRNEGYLDTIALMGTQCMGWTLRSKAFLAIKEYLPYDCDRGFRSESPNHDVMTLRLQLGDWVTHPKNDDLLFTEQELRRLSSADYPDWVPFDINRRPDGYRRSADGIASKAIGVEVEISPKSNIEYETLALDYAHCSKIERVIWGVPSKMVANKIASTLAKYQSPRGPAHSFVLNESITESGWSSRVIAGSNLNTMVRDLLKRKCDGSVSN
jgi:hypothetical protein